MLELLLLALPQAPTALASTSGDTRLFFDPVVFDEDWVRRQEGPPGAKLYLGSQNLMALLGDLDGDGLFEAPSDIDALAWSETDPAYGPAPIQFLFSTVSNVGPYFDGDLLRMVEGQGVQVVVPESEFVAALQPASGSFDLDAAAHPTPGEFWFSVNSDLTGTLLGDVLDGDVLIYDRALGSVRRHYGEADIQLLVDQAMGGSATAIGDLTSLSFYPPTGEMAFTVQAPSSDDATVYGDGGGGRTLVGWSEVDWDFQDPAELDALAFVPGGIPQPPVFLTDVPFYAPGDAVRFKMRHGTPGSVAEGVRSLRTAYEPKPHDGVGFFFLDGTDPWLLRQLRLGQTGPTLLDSSGSGNFDWVVPDLPAGMTLADLYVQAYCPGGAGWAPPIALRIQ